MAYIAFTVALLALFVSAAAFLVVFRQNARLVASVLKSLETAPEPIWQQFETETGVKNAPEPELEAITSTDEYEYELEKKLIDEGKAVEYS